MRTTSWFLFLGGQWDVLNGGDMSLEPVLISFQTQQCSRGLFQGEVRSWSLQCDEHQLISWMIFASCMWQREPGWDWPEKLFQKPFSFSCNHQCKSAKFALLRAPHVPQGLSCPCVQVMSPRETGNPCWSHLLEAPLTSSQYHWHTLANESVSWPPVFYFHPLVPFRVHCRSCWSTGCPYLLSSGKQIHKIHKIAGV